MMEGNKGTLGRLLHTEKKLKAPVAKAQRGIFTVARQPVESKQIGVQPVNLVAFKGTVRVLAFPDWSLEISQVTGKF